MLAWRRLLVATGLVIPFIWLLVYGFTRDPRYIQSPLIGRQAPDFTLTYTPLTNQTESSNR
jgi:hypothetical protein